MKLWTYLVVLICNVSSTCSIAQTIAARPSFQFQHFDSSNGLPTESLQTITQDSIGFLWMENGRVLIRHDGYDYKIYKHDPTDSAKSLPAALDALSPREVQVMRLVAEGRTSKEIALMLDLGLQTVRSYRKTMMRKLGVRNVAGLTQLALAAGLTHFPKPHGSES